MSEAWAKPAVLALVALLFASACGTSSSTDTEVFPTTSGSVSDQSAAGTLPSVEDVAPDLVSLSELLTVHSEPVHHTFDADGGELALSDGARIEVPAGAFTSPTEVTAVLLDVDYDLYLEFPPEARIYRVSTETDVELSEPVVLEVPGPSDDVQVFGFDDGRWTEELLSAASVTKIEIEHFSVTQHLVMTRPTDFFVATHNRLGKLCTELPDEADVRPCGDLVLACWMFRDLDARNECFSIVESQIRCVSELSTVRCGDFEFEVVDETSLPSLPVGGSSPPSLPVDDTLPDPFEDGLLTWTLVSADGFATQTIVNPIYLRDHDWESNFPFPAGPGRGTTASADDGPNDEMADPGAATTTPTGDAIDDADGLADVDAVDAVDGLDDVDDPIETGTDDVTTTSTATTATPPTTTSTSTTTLAPTTTSAIAPIAWANGNTVLCNNDQRAIRFTNSYRILDRNSDSGEVLSIFDGALATMTVSGDRSAQATTTVSAGLLTFVFDFSPEVTILETLNLTLVIDGTPVPTSTGSLGYGPGNCTYA